MKYRIVIGLFLGMISICSDGYADGGGIPVFDLKSDMNWASHLESMKTQLAQARAQYEAMTGNRKLGSLHYDASLRNTLPPEYRNIYDASRAGNYGISGPLQNITQEEQLEGTIPEMQKSIEERAFRNAATDKAVGLKAYDGAEQRLNQIEALMKKIDHDDVKDMKAIAELQARIAIEQAAIQNEIAKLQMISQLQTAEAKLLEEQKREMNRKLLNTNNTAMPRIRP